MAHLPQTLKEWAQEKFGLVQPHPATVTNVVLQRLGRLPRPVTADAVSRNRRADMATYSAILRAEREDDIRALMESWHGLESIDRTQNWVAVKFLGEGGYGRANLWVRQDSKGIINDRMVVKQVRSESGDAYRDLANWAVLYDLTLPRHRRRPGITRSWRQPIGMLPREAYMHQLASSPPSRNILSYRGCSKQPRKQTFRIYSDYCAYGDLVDLTDGFMAASIPLPEPFIWFVFLSLARACVKLEGPIKSAVYPVGREIVHQDIKPDNVFLADPPPGFTTFNIWPQPKLADFGSSRHTSTADPLNPNMFLHDAWTDGFIPREQYNNYWQGNREEPAPAETRSSPMNVYQVGMVIRSLIRPGHRNDQPDFATAAGRGPVDVTPLIPGISTELTNLISRCLEYHQGNRITAKQLLRELNRHKDRRYRGAQLRGRPGRMNIVSRNHVHQHRYGTRAATAAGRSNAPPTQPQLPFLPLNKTDNYALGLALTDVPILQRPTPFVPPAPGPRPYRRAARVRTIGGFRARVAPRRVRPIKLRLVSALGLTTHVEIPSSVEGSEGSDDDRGILPTPGTIGIV